MYKIKEIINEIKYAYQRVFKGYDESATWDVSGYFTLMLQEIIFDMSENINSFPVEFKTLDEWKKVLKQIAFGFGSLIEMETGIYFSDEKEYKRLEKEAIKGLKLFAKHYQNLWN